MASGVATFYYTDTQAGYPIITAYRASLIADTQTETIRPASLKFSSSSFTIKSTDTASIVAILRNADNCTASLWTSDTGIILSSSSKGRFSLASTPWSDTTTVQFSWGVASFYYKDKLGGNPVLSITRYTFQDTQQDTVTRPIVTISKIQYNMRSSETGPYPMKMASSDTIEYTIYITNTGSETSTANIIMDTRAFDTYTNNPVEYIWMDTSTVASTWSYSIDTPTLNWFTGSPPGNNIDYVKGLKWQIDTLGINETKAIKFRVRIR